MFKDFNRCDFFVLLWILYNIEDILRIPGIINRIITIIIVSWCSIVSVKIILNNNKPLILKSLLCLVGMFCIYGIIPIIEGKYFIINGEKNASYSYLIMFLNSLLPIILFYYYTQKGLLTSKKIITYTFIFLITTIIQFYYYKYNQFILLGREETTNNIGYTFVSLIPLIFFLRKNIFLEYILLGIIGLFILLSMKRGAILIGGISIIIFLSQNLKNAKRKQKIIILLFSFAVIVAGLYYTSYMIQTSDYFVRRLEQTVQGDSSGRDIIYNTLWQSFLHETNLLYILFGRGANATLDIAGIHAHQDWLETVICTGIMGVLILFIFFISLAKTIIKQKNRFHYSMYYSFLILGFIIFSKTMFSMSIQDLHLSQSLVLGYFIYWSKCPKEKLVNM